MGCIAGVFHQSSPSQVRIVQIPFIPMKIMDNMISMQAQEHSPEILSLFAVYDPASQTVLFEWLSSSCWHAHNPILKDGRNDENRPGGRGSGIAQLSP